MVYVFGSTICLDHHFKLVSIFLLVVHFQLFFFFADCRIHVPGRARVEFSVGRSEPAVGSPSFVVSKLLGKCGTWAVPFS